MPMAILESEYRNEHKIYILVAKTTKAGFETLNLRYYKFGSKSLQQSKYFNNGTQRFLVS